MSERTWHLRSRGINEVVRASDQFAAWDSLQERPIEDFGLIVAAEPDENGDPIPVQTETLMRRWGRDEDADAFSAMAVSLGLKEAP